MGRERRLDSCGLAALIGVVGVVGVVGLAEPVEPMVDCRRGFAIRLVRLLEASIRGIRPAMVVYRSRTR
jgi:hypothetical protein